VKGQTSEVRVNSPGYNSTIVIRSGWSNCYINAEYFVVISLQDQYSFIILALNDQTIYTL